MQTIEILSKIQETIYENPGSIPTLPWEDIKLCLLTELEYRQELYTDSQYQQIQSVLQNEWAELIQPALETQDAMFLSLELEKLIFSLQLLPNTDTALHIMEQSHFNQACLRHYRNNTIIVLGDSHVNFFSGNEQINYVPIGHGINICPPYTNLPFTALHLGPCLAYNCNRPDSSTRFRLKMDYLCQDFIQPGAILVCCLGEIDLRVHVFRQTTLQNTGYQPIIDSILQQYIIFLQGLQQAGYRVFCWGPIATQKDTCPIDSHFPRVGTESERNQATAYFNQQLSALCMEHDIGFLSIFDSMVTPQWETIDSYLSDDHCHLSQRALPLALPLWQEKLFPYLQ